MRIQSIIAAALLLIAAGCGSGEQPLPEATIRLVEAREAIAAGNDEAALAALNDSLESQPMVWAYYERAKLKLKSGDEIAARADCDAALEIAPNDPEVKWFKGELAKPADKRFQGQFKHAPSSRR